MASFGAANLFDEFNNESSVDKRTKPLEDEDSDNLEDNEEDDDDYKSRKLRQYKSQIHQLKKENSALKKSLRIFTQQPSLKVREIMRDGPVAHLVLFHNTYTSELAEDLKRTISRKIEKYSSSDKQFLSKTQSSSLQYAPKTLRHNYDYKKSERNEKKLSKVFTATHSLQFYKGDFYIDHLGEPNTENESKIDYERGCLDPMNGTIEYKDDLNKKSNRSCWNCGSLDHQLNTCPEPRNHKNIQQARTSFLEQAHGSFSSCQRYHDDEVDERFAQFKSGVISDSLRSALGISSKQLPLFIYRMRYFGYPPGHLEDAFESQRPLNLYKDANEMNTTVDDYVDVSKLIPYIGFNVDDRSYVDEHQLFGCPPIDPEKSFEKMMKYYEDRNKKNKPEVKPPVSLEDDRDLEDMDLESEEQDESIRLFSNQLKNTNCETINSSTPKLDNHLANNRNNELKKLEESEKIVYEDGELHDEDVPETTSCDVIEDVDLSDEESCPDTRSVPHRSNFASGITEFNYCEETPSRGTYDDLMKILKK